MGLFLLVQKSVFNPAILSRNGSGMFALAPDTDGWGGDTNVGRIEETDKEKAMPDKELKDSCYEFARNNFQGKFFKNAETGSDIIVSKDGLGEWKSKSKSREQILSIKILDKLLESGKLNHEAPDKQGRKNIEKIIYLNSVCLINGMEYNVIITVRRIKNYGDKYYHHYLEDINIGPHSGTTRPSGKTV
jgi:hypothetical protein